MILICLLIFWILFSFGLVILIFIGVLILVVSMLICVLIGIIYVLVSFGNLIRLLSFFFSFLVVMFLCYCDFGFNWIKVLIMVSGVGFVVVFVWFILLNIDLIFGILVINLLVCCKILWVLFIEIFG